MASIIEKEYIICGSCRLKFEPSKEYKHCSNCFACTVCEIYYCPRCDEEIVITPLKAMRHHDSDKKQTVGSKQYAEVCRELTIRQ